MSTKIYNAYVCPEGKTLLDMHELIIGLKPKIKKELVSRYHRRAAKDWAHYVDGCVVLRRRIKKQFYEISEEVRSKYQKIEYTGIREPLYDFYFNVMVIPHKGRVYLKIFCEEINSDLCAGFESIGCKDFYYQDSTDRPDNIPEKEWEKRSKTWSSIFEKSEVWNDLGFEYDFSASAIYDWPFNPADVSKYFPSIPERAIDIVKDRISHRVYSKSKSFSYVMSYLRSDDGKKEILRRCKILAPKLTKDLVFVDEVVAKGRQKTIQKLLTI